MKILVSPNIEIYDMMMCSQVYRQEAICAARSSKDITRDMIRVKSSNLWSYTMNIKDGSSVGDVYVQFKDSKGGPGDVYVYYDVPVKVYRRWHTATSKGHFFWLYIRDKYWYAKLTGDKKTKLRNGISEKAAQQKSKPDNDRDDVSNDKPEKNKPTEIDEEIVDEEAS